MGKPVCEFDFCRKPAKADNAMVAPLLTPRGQAKFFRVAARGIKADADAADLSADDIFAPRPVRADHDIGIAAFHRNLRYLVHDLDFDTGMALLELREIGHEPVGSEAVGHGDADKALRFSIGAQCGMKRAL